jgi:hypothetical protein
MKYLTYNLIAAANDWVEQTEDERRLAENRLRSAVESYRHELGILKPRVSREAWEFFRHGSDRYGLHDARLLSFIVGDGLDYVPDGSQPFLINRQRAAAHVEFLNHEQDFHYRFDLRGVSRVRGDLFVDEESYAKSIGDLYTYELTEIDKDTLQLGFLFATGASVIVQFQRLLFRRRRVKREYEVGDIYRLKQRRA